MAITTWASFLQQLTRLLDGEDVSATTITPNTLGQIISLGERRIYREVRSRWNEKAYINVICSNNRADLPTDFEAPSTTHLGSSALEPASEEFVIDRSMLSQTKYYAIAGNQFMFGGPVTDGTILQGRYYYRLPDLSATTLPTNNLFLNEPDLFIFGCLSQAAPFFDQDARQGLWEGRYSALRDEINDRHLRSAYSSGRMKRRPSARLTSTAAPRFSTATLIVGAYVDNYVNSYA